MNSSKGKLTLIDSFLQQASTNFALPYHINQNSKEIRTSDKENENADDIEEQLKAINDIANKSKLISIL